MWILDAKVKHLAYEIPENNAERNCPFMYLFAHRAIFQLTDTYLRISGRFNREIHPAIHLASTARHRAVCMQVLK